MEFSEAWDTFEVNDIVTVRLGGPPPSTNTDGMPYKAWMSNNFTGKLVEKIDGPWRYMRFELEPNEHGNVIGFTLAEGAGHIFAEGFL